MSLVFICILFTVYRAIVSIISVQLEPNLGETQTNFKICKISSFMHTPHTKQNSNLLLKIFGVKDTIFCMNLCCK